MAKKYDKLLSECQIFFKADRSDRQEIVTRSWNFGRILDDYIKKNRLSPQKEGELLDKLRTDLKNTELPTFIRIYREFPDPSKAKRNWILSYYKILLRFGKEDRTELEKMLDSGKIKNRWDLNKEAARRKGKDTSRIWA